MDARQGLIRHGLTLFLAGLVTGFIIPLTANPRAGLASHLEGVANGTFLLALGCAWGDLRLGEVAGRWVFRLVLFGAWVNWAGTLLSSVFGTSKLTPIAGAGHSGAPWQENLVIAMLVSVGLAMVLAVGATAWHMWRAPQNQ
jgi:hydroxylaminobenzene mutase